MGHDATYFDLQVNGYGGFDFNRDDLTGEQLREACERLEANGVGGFLATIITEQIDVMARRLGALARFRAQDEVIRRVLAGVHIEGPFISDIPGYVGAHPKDAVTPANEEDMERLLDAAEGLTRGVTLAPERDPGQRVTRMLSDRGVTVSAGHCDPTLDDLKAGIDAGLGMFTHLGNGCPLQMHRHDNIIQRALSLHEHLTLCFVADGVHVPLIALGNYLRAGGVDRCAVVTDAIAPAGLGPGRYTLGRWELDIGADLVGRAPDGSHLVGSAVTMPDAWRNLTEGLGLSESEARALTCENPRRAVGLDPKADESV
jgi:N-acetylglucosamine-6-phosphate deacetylase